MLYHWHEVFVDWFKSYRKICYAYFEDSKGVNRSRKSKKNRLCQKEKEQKNKQWSTKHTHKTKDWATWAPLKTWIWTPYSRRVSSCCFICGILRATHVTNTMIRHESGKYLIGITTNGTYPWSFLTQIFRSHGGDNETFVVMTSTSPLWTLQAVASFSAANVYQGNHHRNHKLWNSVLTEIYIIYFICRCCWNVVTHKWKDHYGKI